MKGLHVLFTMSTADPDVTIHVMPWGQTEENGRRAVLALRRKGDEEDTELYGIFFGELAPGKHIPVRLSVVNKEWVCEEASHEGDHPKFALQCLHIAAEAGRILQWPLWEIYHHAQSQVGWDGPEIVQISVVSQGQLTEILGQRMAAHAAPVEA